jgi:hypothetical protein
MENDTASRSISRLTSSVLLYRRFAKLTAATALASVTAVREIRAYAQEELAEERG